MPSVGVTVMLPLLTDGQLVFVLVTEEGKVPVLVTVAVPVLSQPCESTIYTVYVPAANPVNTFELCKAPPFNPY